MADGPAVCPSLRRAGRRRTSASARAATCRSAFAARGRWTTTGERHERARKVKRQYAEGELVTVATGRNQAEADFVANLLLEEGVPSLVRRSRGFDVPDMLAAGPRDVLVPQSGRGGGARDPAADRPARPRRRRRGRRPGACSRGCSSASRVVALIVWLGSLLS